MKFETLLFDLDGTLTDSGPGIMNCVRYMLEKYGITDPAEADLRACVGPPLTESFEKYWGFNHEEALKGVEIYRERYKPIGIFENELYEGIPQMLEALQKAGVKLYLATSKPTFMAETVLAHFGIAKYFTEIAGASEDEKLNRKDDIIEDLLSRIHPDPATTAMVGDRKYDIAGGRKFGLKTVGVYYGYAEAGELEPEGADYIADTVAELAEILLS